MSDYVPTKVHLREVSLHHFLMKKTAAESYRILVEVYGEYAPAENTCRKRFRRFKAGDFDVDDKERSGRPKKFDDKELEALLEEDPNQTHEQLAESLGVDTSTVYKRLKATGKIPK